MYQFELTIHEDHDGYNCHGSIWQGEKKVGEPLMTAHAWTPYTIASDRGSHVDMIMSAVLVCQELAQNLDDTLF